MKTKIKMLCQLCEGEYFVYRPYRVKESKYCSRSCKSKAGYSKARDAGFGFREEHIPWNKGIKTGIVPRSAFQKGQTPWNKNTADLLKRRISNTFKAAISRSVKGRKNGRHWETMIGFTLAELMVHLEHQFQPDMTWDNYGEWHIDHIIPIVAFNIISAESPDFKRCWALSNLQPLWKTENLKKNQRIDKPFQPSLDLAKWASENYE